MNDTTNNRPDSMGNRLHSAMTAVDKEIEAGIKGANLRPVLATGQEPPTLPQRLDEVTKHLRLIEVQLQRVMKTLGLEA